jgi:hypothetical protein
MKKLLTPGRNLAVPLLLGFWGSAHAQSLGTASAEVLLGKPLEMTVPARFDAADRGDPCVHADVFYGETRLRADQVRATVTGTEGQRRIRIESATPIDEPVVTVSVRAGCRNTVTRNYTLLPEYPSEPLLAALETRMRAAAAGTLAAAPVAAPAPRTSPRIVPARPTREIVAEARQAVAAPAASARALRKEAPARGARLKLEPLDALEPEARTLLRASHALAEPGGDAARRATAALLWKAINADPQELLRTSQMLQKLESDLAQLRQATGQTRAEMAALRQRLDQAQPWYASATLAQLLAVLVLAAGTAAGVLWYRTRRLDARAQAWFVPGAAPAQPAQADAVAAPAESAAPAERAAPAVPVAVATPRIPEAIDFALPASVAHAPVADGALRVETLAATFEEVEFLSSLGLASDAMDVLRTYLQDSSGPAPLAFLELMRLCEQDDDAMALASVRRRYAHAFGTEPPRLQDVTASLGLESLPELSARITRAWGTPQALQLIEESLFTVPAPGLPLTLQAGRDLVCLHGLAMALVKEAAPGCAGDEADAHPLAPWAAHADDPAAAQAAAQAVAEAQGGHRFALDVDLTGAPESLPALRDRTEELELAPLLAELKAAAARNDALRAQAEAEEAFSAAVASERVPVSRF